MIALPYLASALSKLRNGGVAWWDPTNLRYHFLRATLNPMHFDFSSTLALMPAPDAMFEALGLGSLLVELVYPAVLFSRRARLVLPIAIVVFHATVLVLQNLLFLDLMLLQAVVFAGGLARPPRAREVVDIADARYPWLLGAVTAGLLGAWIARLELYPLSSLQMFSRVNRSGTVEYYRILGENASGAVEPFDIGACSYRSFAVMPVLKATFDPARRAVTSEFLTAPRGTTHGYCRPSVSRGSRSSSGDGTFAASPTARAGAMVARYDQDVGG